jgi:hypothetical protein
MDNAGASWELPGALRVLVAIVVLVSIVAICARARADERADLERASANAGDAGAEALFLLAEIDERELDFAHALAHYQDSYARSPSSRYAQRAMNRVNHLKARSEGGFAPLARLERVRRDPALANDPSAIEALARDAEAFPPGLVRVEAWSLIGEAYVGRMNRHADGEAILRRVVDDSNADPLSARQAARLLVDTIAQDGQTDLAVATARTLRTKLDPQFVTSIERRVRRRAVHRVAIAVIAGMLALVAIALARSKSRERVVPALRASAPVAIGFAAYVGIAGGFLASSYEAGNAKPFFVFGAAALPIFVAARAWGAAGSQTAAARALRAAACAAAMLAAAFVVLEGIDPAYLEGFGL